MSTERIDIVVGENGSRTVKRNLEDVGKAGRGAGQGVQLLQKALAGLAVGAALTFLQRQLDLYTNIQNRLKLVTSGTAELSGVTEELFAISNRTRNSYEATATVFSRVALAAKDLGVSNQRLLQFTESLNQAVILSGASAAEAEAAMIQLSQGLASGTLRGDELRSVLEQLPYVADVIAKSLGVTRGELRKMGEDGKITAKVVLDAFQGAREELAGRFAQTVPTIGQAFTVLGNNVLQFVGEMDKAIGVSAALSKLLVAVAGNLRLVALAAATVTLAFVMFKAVLLGQAVLTYVRSLVALEVALGATSVRAALAGVTLKGLQAVMMTLTSTAFVLGAALVAASAGVVYLVNDSLSAQSALDSLTQSGAEVTTMLQDAQMKADAAGVSVDQLSAASGQGDTLARALASAYNIAADAAARLAANARMAAIAVAQGKIMELQAKRASLIGTEESAKGGNFGSALKYTAQGVLGEFGIGPTIKERQAGARSASAQINQLTGLIETYKVLPDGSFADKAIPGGAATGKKDGAKKGGGGGGGGQTRAEFLAEVNGETQTSIRLSALLDEQWRATSSQMAGIQGRMAQQGWGALSPEEASALEQSLGLMNDMAAVEQTRDGIARRFAEPRKELLRVEQGANELLEAGIITLEQHTRAMEDARLAVLDLGTSATDGLERGLIRIMQEARDEAYRTERALVGIWQEAKGPQLDFEAGLKAVNKLLAEQRIGAEDARVAVLRLSEAYLSTKNDATSGIQLGRTRVDLDKSTGGADRIGGLYQDEYNKANSGMQELQERASVLKQLMQDDPINSGSYAQRLREVGVEATILQGSMPGASVFDAMRAGLAEFVRDFRGMIPGLSRIWGSFVTRVGDGFANAIGRAIVYGESLGAALKDVARSAMAELISSLVKLGIQWLVMQVIGQGAQAAISATGAAAGAATAAAWAPAAAAVSLATFGANSGPAMAGIATTYALTQALSMAGGKGFRDGGYTGGRGVNDVAGVVHGQEFVFDAAATGRLGVPFLEALRQGRVGGYKKGGAVGSGSISMGSRGSIDRAGSGGDTISVSIDARGAEAGVEDRIADALDEALPVFLAKARKQENDIDRRSVGRQRIGSRSGR